MRIERWYWLGVFCLISLGIHLGIALRSPAFYSAPRLEKPTEIEVALEAPPPEVIKPAAEIKPVPPPPKPAPNWFRIYCGFSLPSKKLRASSTLLRK